ncbi:SNF2-related protein [Massilia aquatica]|uniref:ATP-dependent helicase n=1 Tax=Massilia aquatica TaxID=2609000 RepID=A0ABX0MQX0_9BURK|nr:SNF2-related protein [Massilia aquatica]NHZ44616.1 ATP-dependent helicase [Massilia aquatica]
MFKFLKKDGLADKLPEIFRTLTATGILVSAQRDDSARRVDSGQFNGYASQLLDEGLATELPEGIAVTWESYYNAVGQSTFDGLAQVLEMPSFTAARIALRSNGSLADLDFSIAVASWRNANGSTMPVKLTGPVMRDGSQERLMLPSQWCLFTSVVAFSRRPDEQRNDIFHRQAWGRIRKLALQADAALDDFLIRSTVLTPEKLMLEMRKSDVVTDDRVVEIMPTFSGAPARWLETFDSSKEVRDRYDVVTDEGIVQVLIEPKVRTVLQEVKRLEHRRVAGARAQAFILNPYAALGPDAVDVIDETEFENARAAAGLNYERFSPVVEHDGVGFPVRVGILIETADVNGPASSETEWFDETTLPAFINTAEKALRVGHQLLAWSGFELELQGDSQRNLDELKTALVRWQGASTLVSYAQVHDLSGYSARIEGIGVEKQYHSAYIAKKTAGDGWFPDNVVPLVVYRPMDGGEPVAVPTTKLAIESLERETAAAINAGKDTVRVSWLPDAVAVAEATAIVETFKDIFKEIEMSGSSLPPSGGKTKGHQGEPPTQLILRANIQKVEYEELRREALEAIPHVPMIPMAIRPEVSLLPHQVEGLAWMQHLYSLQNEYQVRGAILADDMGLGKTFQLLALMAGLLERDPSISPMLVVAPVSLLENWAEEAGKFFTPGSLPLLTAYGAGLDGLKVPRSQIEQRLQTDDRLVKFLVPNWVGSAKIVLTTYETLRDLEFSFAAQKWSLMVCDEAQKIKNPAAMVTRAAKKQNVDFKIACTGTPVENTLADLWCLFDFVQPGLLGALNDFGKRYRKPIEANTDEEKERVAELRARIAPQVLRRMKSVVAMNLPPKIIVEDCRALALSTTQRNLYAKAVESFKKRNDEASMSPFKNHLGLLHYLRLVCTDPRPHGLGVFKPEPVGDYRGKAPKLDWLLTTLKGIKSKSEKAIVFCEFREIQRLLQHYIEVEFGLRPDIINGDTSASASHTQSRQKRIKAFQDRPGFGVIILSPVAVGFGVNIQKANHVIHYTRTWNPAKEDQATDRAYRIGQEKPVYVYYPVVSAQDFTTFDVKLDQLLTYKRKLAEDMLNGSGDIGPGEFTLADVIFGADAGDIDERVSLAVALRMSGQHFECLAGVLWTRLGNDCYRTPTTKDYGVDVVALRGEQGKLIQAKTCGTDGTRLGWEAVKEVVAGEAFYRRRHPKVQFQKVCITNQFFNAHASENAALNQVELLDQLDLEAMLNTHAVTMLEVERMLYTEWG